MVHYGTKIHEERQVILSATTVQALSGPINWYSIFAKLCPDHLPTKGQIHFLGFFDNAKMNEDGFGKMTLVGSVRCREFSF
jgi:hypothetical protein